MPKPSLHVHVHVHSLKEQTVSYTALNLTFKRTTQLNEQQIRNEISI